MACNVAWRHQAITWTNVDLLSVRSSGIHLKAISQEIPQPPFTKVSLKITYLKLSWNLPGANELNVSIYVFLASDTLDGPAVQSSRKDRLTAHVIRDVIANPTEILTLSLDQMQVCYLLIIQSNLIIIWQFPPKSSQKTSWHLPWETAVNSCPPEQNVCNFADDIFERIFLNKNVRIFI